ncbi:MAG: hypothetical protein Kow00120_23030 [Anaerolineae bacterium]
MIGPVSAFEVQVAHSVDEVGQEVWDRLSAGRPFTSYRWYRFGEAVLDDGRPLYIVLWQRGAPVARATFWLDMQEELPIASGLVRRPVETALRRWPLMICRAPLPVAVSGLTLPEPPLRDAALAALVAAAQEQAGRHRVSFIAFDHLEREATGWPGWPASFAQAAFSEPRTRLNLRWPDFESYLRDLSKGARKDYRRHRNRARDLGIAVTPHAAVNTPLDQAMRLIGKVGARHGDRPEAWTVRMLERAAMVEATWLTADIGGDLVGCGLLLGDSGAQFLALLGLDDGVDYVYFQLLYRAIQSAIEQGARLLLGGREAYAVKQRLGFTLMDSEYVLFTSRLPLFQRISHWLRARVGEAA